jgi:hypothetical protein
MSRCTAPVRGHRTASAAADCPACSGRSRGYGGYGSYGSYSSPSYSPSYSPSGSSGGGRSSVGGSGSSARPRWSRAGSSVVYTPTEVRTLTPVRKSVEKRGPYLTLGTSFFAMRGTTGEGPPRICTICSRHAVSRSGSARRTSPLARRCSAKSTRDWRNPESGSCW